jgi:hypothetical protein
VTKAGDSGIWLEIKAYGGTQMNITKAKLETFLEDLPEQVDTEEVMYRLYLLEKIEAGEADIAEGHTLSHEEAVQRLTRKWRQ